MRYILLLTLLFSAFSFNACKKEPLTYIIKGTLTDAVAGTPVSGAKISAYIKVYDQNALNNNKERVAEVMTDASGQYNIEIERVRLIDFEFIIEHADYYYYNSIHSENELTTDGDNTFNHSIDAKGWLRLILNNPIVTSDEQLNLHKSDFREGCEDCCTNGGMSFIQTPDTSFVCAVTGGSTVHLDFGVVGSGANQSYDITCTAFDTTDFVINY